jgi:TRAP transporter TAXI family solute receptor
MVGLQVNSLGSPGSQENLQRLLDRKADFALTQLDVAHTMMQQGKVQAVAIVAYEHVHIVTQGNLQLRSLPDLKGKRVGMGAPGSGIRFTSDQLMQAANVSVKADPANFDQTFPKLAQRELDAAIYVGSMGASQKLRERFRNTPQLQLLPISIGMINYILAREPGIYQAAFIPAGTYRAYPPLPLQDVPTLATATVLVTRPDMDSTTVGLVTWAILSSSRKFTRFYPELQIGDARFLLQRGLFYLHPKAQEVFDQGDPRQAWVRYLENNSDLQAGVMILLATSGIGLLLQQWRRDRVKKLISTTLRQINELQKLLNQDPKAALAGIESLSQEHRLMFIEGVIAPDVYEQVRQKTQLFMDDCRNLVVQQRQQCILETLLLVDDWQALLQVDPEAAIQKVSTLKQQYREMLLAEQVDIEAYIELLELTLLSIMTLAPRTTGKMLLNTDRDDDSSELSKG